MKPFTHYNSASVSHTLTLLQYHEGKANLIAGGTDLLGVLKDEILNDAPEALINIKTIPDMNHIVEDEEGLIIGALCTLRDIERSVIIQQKYGVLAEAAKSVATPEIRNMGTVGGNLCQDTRCWYYRYPHAMGGRIQCRRKGDGTCLAVSGDNRYHSIFGGKKCFAVCPSDMAVALVALDATIDIIGPDGPRSLAIVNFYHSLGTALQPHEWVTRIRVPHSPKSFKHAFIKFRVRESIDFAIASVACTFDIHNGRCKDARIVLGAVAPGPRRAEAAEAAIIEKRFSNELAITAANAAVLGAKPLKKNNYKVELIQTLVRRAIMIALELETASKAV